jgi:hypothetical protein
MYGDAGLVAKYLAYWSSVTMGTSPRFAEKLRIKNPLTPEIIRLNNQLPGKIAESPALNDQQRAIIRKLYDQVKSRGAFDSIKMPMDDGGIPFNAEQVSQVQPLLDQQNEARVQLTKEAQGQPDKAKLNQLQRDTPGKVF